MLERVKTFGIVGMTWMQFAYEKDIKLGVPEAEYYKVLIPNVMVLGDGAFWK